MDFVIFVPVSTSSFYIAGQSFGRSYQRNAEQERWESSVPYDGIPSGWETMRNWEDRPNKSGQDQCIEGDCW